MVMCLMQMHIGLARLLLGQSASSGLQGGLHLLGVSHFKLCTVYESLSCA